MEMLRSNQAALSATCCPSRPQTGPACSILPNIRFTLCLATPRCPLAAAAPRLLNQLACQGEGAWSKKGGWNQPHMQGLLPTHAEKKNRLRVLKTHCPKTLADNNNAKT